MTTGRMTTSLDRPVLTGRYVTLVPPAPEHVGELRRIRSTPEVVAAWRDPEPGWPGDEDPDTVHYTVLHDGVVRGFVQYSEETDPDYRSASIDLFLDPAVHHRGLGRDTVATLAAHLFDDRGHHRITIDPAADNTVAIRCYTAVGFRPVGVMRRYERDADGQGWHDGLLMDLLPEDLRR